ncbi:MAG TPA: GNAT family N-acetyltransferase [Chitinophagaceae bacterium]|jgi:ribosomal protein S18 acetylase RimI-like enzyme|nr:GNAT family N-acetyltransferase [Chitinophagaceae bacterium]
MLAASSISIATPDDINELVHLVNKSYRGDTSKKGWTTEAHLLDGIRTDEASLKEMMNCNDAVILKYIDANNLVGCVYLQKQAGQMYLGMLSVLPEIQAKGIGKQLLKASEEYAKQKKCDVIQMTVISVRTELINWYERHGYFQTGETKPFPDDVRFGIPKQLLEFIVLQKKL